LRAPYDAAVRDGRKRAFEWSGDTGQVTDCGADALPHRSTQVETAPAMQQDHHARTALHATLADTHPLPQQHLVAAGDSRAKRILERRDTHDSDLIGPVPVEPRWQAHPPGACAVAPFHVDWEHHVVTGPQGEQRSAWHRGTDAQGASVVTVWFSMPPCQTCPLRPRCPQAPATGRSMTRRFPPARHELLVAARARHKTAEFRAVYQARCGLEGTCAHTARTTGLRRARSLGQRTTQLQHLFTAPATKILRLGCWLEGAPFATTRTSRFAALAASFLVRQQYRTHVTLVVSGDARVRSIRTSGALAFTDSGVIVVE
jgi:transposase